MITTIVVAVIALIIGAVSAAVITVWWMDYCTVPLIARITEDSEFWYKESVRWSELAANHLKTLCHKDQEIADLQDQRDMWMNKCKGRITSTEIIGEALDQNYEDPELDALQNECPWINQELTKTNPDWHTQIKQIQWPETDEHKRTPGVGC